MFPFILNKEEAEEITKPFWYEIYSAMKEGFETYTKVRKEYLNHSYFHNRLRAEIIRTKTLNIFIEKYDKQKFSNDVRIVHDIQSDLVFIVIKEQLALRIKKLDRGLRANFNKTKLSKKFIDQQLSFESLVPSIHKLLLGWRHDETWTKFLGVYIKPPQNAAWAILLDEERINNIFTQTPNNIKEFSINQTLPEEPIVKPKIETVKVSNGIS